MNRQNLAAAVLVAIPTAMSLPAMHHTGAPQEKQSSLEFCQYFGCTIWEDLQWYIECLLVPPPGDVACELIAIS